MPAAASSTTSRWSSSATRFSASSSPTCCSGSSRSTTRDRSRSSRLRSCRQRRWPGWPRSIGLGDYLILGRGEEKTGGRKKLALISDCYEALIAAIYLDGGIEPARGFIERQFERLIDEARRTGAHATFTEDYKSALQEWLQQHDRGLPVYRLAAEAGPAHRRTFEVEVLVNGAAVARAEGKSKKEAAQAAARQALDALSEDEV